MYSAFLLAAMVGIAVAAAPAATNIPAEPPAVSVSAQVAAVSPDTVTLLWRFDLTGRWHLYGPFLNDSGFPPDIRLDLPDGWRAEPPRWPVPERHLLAGEILDHVYHDTLVLPQVVHRPRGALHRSISARISWLACLETCVPGDTTLTLAVPTTVAPAAASELATVLTTLPRPLSANQARVTRTDEAVEIVVPGARRLTLIPEESAPRLVDLAADGEVSGNRLRLRLRPDSTVHKPLIALLIIDHNTGDKIAGSIVVQ